MRFRITKLHAGLTFLLLLFFASVKAQNTPTLNTTGGMSPTNVTYRTTITLTGTNFTTGTVTVNFYTGTGSTGASVAALSTTVNSATQITAVVPAVIATGSAAATRYVSVSKVVNSTTYTGNAISYTFTPPAATPAAATVTNVITNYGTNGWISGTGTTGYPTNVTQPDNAHSLMAFRYGGVTYSTGDEAAITGILTSAGYAGDNTGTAANKYKTGNWRALPINNIAGTVSSGGSLYVVLGSLVDGSATSQVYTAPSVAGLTARNVLIDGIRGLGLGTGVTNLPATSPLTFATGTINPDVATDAIPDIMVTQIASPTENLYTTYCFVDANGNIVGVPVEINMFNVSKLGTYKSDFFTLTTGATFNESVVSGVGIATSTRDIRIAAYKLSDFGITETNRTQVAQFKVMLNGNDDPAFMAYNRNSFQIPAPEITTQPVSQAVCPSGTATFTVAVTATSSGTETPVYQWQRNGVSLTNGSGVSGATTATLTINPVAVANYGIYRCVVTNSSGAAYSNAAYLNSVFLTTTTSAATCQSTATTLTAAAVGNTPQYQWFITANDGASTATTGGTAVTTASAANTSYQPSVAAGGTKNYYVVAYPANTACAPTTSAIIPVTVTATAAAGTATGTQTICPGTTALLQLSGYTGTIQWQVSADNTTFTNVADGIGGTTASYTTPVLTATRYYKAVVTSGSCGTATSTTVTVTVNTTFTWTGNTNTDWSNTGNWSCNTVPSLTTTVIIPAAPVNQPHVLANTAEALAKTITVEEGASVTVNTSGTLRVADNITVGTTASFVVENNAAFIQNNSVANTGIITVKRNSNALYRLDYTLWSSPVTGQNFGTFSPATISNRFYEYRYGFDAVNGNAYREQYWAVPTSSTFVAGRGFLIRMPDAIPGNTTYAAGTSTAVHEGIFTGEPNNGNIQPSLTLGTANDDQSNHYYAVGNPYPSPISVLAFYTDTDNATRIKAGSALYFWRKKNNSTVSSYATLNLSGYASNSGSLGFGGGNNAAFYPSNTDANPANNLNWIISPGQGFLVKLAAGVTQNVVFKNSMRRAATAASATPAGQPFFKTAQNSAPSRYWLNLADATGVYSQALIAYSQEGTLDVDYGYDGLELAQGTIRLYSKQAENNFTIQARPSFTVTDEVAVGYTVTAAGQYTLNLDQMDGVFEGSQNIYLKDNQLGTTYDLKSGGYIFTTDAGTFGDRFAVVYATNTLDVTSPEFALNNVLVYKANGSSTVNITSGSLDMTGVTVYDIRGRQIYSKELSGTQATIADLNIANQVIIVEVTTTAGKVNKKVLF